ncbi:G protein-coupled receptor GPR1, partial [Pseudocercospora fuligena]
GSFNLVAIFSFRRVEVLKEVSLDPSSAVASALFGTIPLGWLNAIHSRDFYARGRQGVRLDTSLGVPPNTISPRKGQTEELATRGAVAWADSEPLKSLKSASWAAERKKLPIESCVTPHSTSGTQTCISQFSVIFRSSLAKKAAGASRQHQQLTGRLPQDQNTVFTGFPEPSDVQWASTEMPLLPLVDSIGNMRGIGQVWHDAMALSPTSTVSAPSSAHTAAMQELYDMPLQTRESLGYNPDFNASAILAQTQQYQVQVIASTFSSVSILAALCALYWFCMMRRNFRRDLVLLLIIGDFWKSSWFLIFSSTTLARGHIYTESSFCQASGYFLQVGLEACDCAIFLMSLHMSLQIFPPARSFLGHDGLYRIRHFVIAGWFVVPNIMSALAFVNSGPAYISQGGFCSLPVRPIWYRLALSWIPRYLIWIFVMGVAIRIYRHVGFEFRVFGQENDQSSSVGIPNINTSALNTGHTAGTVPMRRDLSSISDGANAEKQSPADDDIAPDDDSIARGTNHKSSLHGILKAARFNEGRRSSVPTWSSPFGNAPSSEDQIAPGPLSPGSKSLPSRLCSSATLGLR